MRAYVTTIILTPATSIPAVTRIAEVTLSLTGEEAGMLKMLANGMSTHIVLVDNDSRTSSLNEFQSRLWEELDARKIEAYYGSV